MAETQKQESRAAAATMKAIDAGKLEKELAAMWAEATESKDGGAPQAGVTRACVLNLIVYASEQEDRTKIDELLDEVTVQNPCRAVILVADREATEAKLNAYVSTRCRTDAKGRKQICGEQVTVEASGPVVDTVASAVEPLLVSDVPVFLWWKDIPHYQDKLFNRMVEMADRIVIDSVAFDHPHDDLRRLAQILQEHPQFMRVSDLNWGRLTAWRTLVASFWDVQDYRPLLDKINRIVIEYDPPDVARDEIAPQALLVLGWLASRLGWEVVASGAKRSETGAQFTLQRAADKSTINVEMRATEDKEGSDGLIASLMLSDEEDGAEFYVEVRPDGTKLETGAKIGGGKRDVGRVLAYERRSDGQRLSRELQFLSRDKVYEHAVAVAAKLCAAMGSK